MKRDIGLVPASVGHALRLVVGGGYDDSMTDNVETLRANLDLCDDLGLSYYVISSPNIGPPPSDVDVLFVLNFSTAQRSALLLAPNTLALLYTPTNEHFGIVPIEAMACGLPVLACNTGGPTETVVDFAKASEDEKPTGYLRSPKPEDWAPALAALINLSADERAVVSETAKARVRSRFSSETLGRELDSACREAVAVTRPQGQIGDKLIRVSLTIILLSLAALALAVRMGSA